VARVTLRDGWDWDWDWGFSTSSSKTRAACGLGIWIGGGDECKSLLLHLLLTLPIGRWQELIPIIQQQKYFRFCLQVKAEKY
jgi:hypothetical protein